MLLTLGLAASISFSGPPKLLQGVYDIVCVGDSITEMGDSPHGYVRLARETLRDLFPGQNIAVENSGISGQQAPDMLARWNKDVIAKTPDLVTLSVGINDVWHGFDDAHPKGDGPHAVPLELYARDVSAMVDSALAHHIKIVVISPTVITEDAANPQNVKLQAYVDAEREIAEKAHIPFVDLHKTFLAKLAGLRRGADGPALHLTVDGVHMNADGDKLMAHGLLRALGVPESKLDRLAD